jgi:hypothetical protein
MMMLLRALLMMASSEDLTMEARRRFVASARLRNVTSLKISTVSWTVPFSLRIGAALSSIAISVPSLAMRIVWLARPTIRLPQNFRHGTFYCLAAQFIDDAEDLVEMLAAYIGCRPAEQ